MKKYTSIALALILVAGMMAGCRNRNNNVGNTSEPTVMPTVEMPTVAPTEASTAPTTEHTVPSETIDNGNGPLPTDTIGENGTHGTTEGAVTEDTTPVSRSRSRVPRTR